MLKRNIDNVIAESINDYLSKNIICEKKSKNNSKSKGKDKPVDDDDSDGKKDKKFRKNAIKAKGGLRKDFDAYDDKIYNKNVNDMEQSDIEKMLNNGFFNIKKVAEKLYPDHTPEGAQSQLNKKIKGDYSDSGTKYRLKTKELRKLRAILSKIM